jgi:hypothetical protein
MKASLLLPCSTWSSRQEGQMQVLADRVVTLIERLEPGDSLDAKLERLVENELLRRLARYELVDKQLTRKYSLSFEEFRRNRVVEQQGYSFEVESDFWDWELALDGVATIRDMLAAMTSPLKAPSQPLSRISCWRSARCW